MNIDVTSFNNAFIEYLCSFVWFDENVLKDMINQYFIGATGNGEPIFWHINAEHEISNGHIITMDKVTGKVYDSSWYYQDERPMCLYGEHLLSTFPNHPVALVKDEITAAVMSCFPTPYIWLASGKDMYSPAVFTSLKDMKVVVFPDKGEYGYCKETFADSPFYISDVMEQSQGNFNTIAQVMLSNLPLRPTEEDIALKKLEISNPNFTKLVDALGLVVVSVTEGDMEDNQRRGLAKTSLASVAFPASDTSDKIKGTQKAKWHGRTPECHQCEHSHEGINGTYCDKLHRYVEYGKGYCEDGTPEGLVLATC